MDTARQQIVDSIKANSNILVTVSTNPTVDELSAALGLTILLDKLDKRATAVFSGTVPPAITFLEPGRTFEDTADSLRDFIIALDKEKADHLRYKVDGDVVKIFITPYKTTLTQKDLEFSQGEFNVELVVAIGVKDQDHLDKALAAHGKILHDATVMTVTIGDEKSSLGSTDWHDGAASSFSEMIVSLADGLKDDKSHLDEQISTALLTGIVSATDRFSNDHTSSRVMTMAAQLMAAGANQQLIAAKLEEAHDIAPNAPKKQSPKASEKQQKPKDSGTELSIDRSSDKTSDTNDSSDAAQESAQKELEESLAGLTGTAAAAPTMADIEKELESAPEEPADEASTESLTAVSDSTMPGFEAPEPLAAVSLPEPEPEQQAPEVQDEPAQPVAPELPLLPPLPELAANEPVASNDTTGEAPQTDPLVSPAIINQHGTFTSGPPSQMPAINSILNDPNEGAPSTVDPFNAPLQDQAQGQNSTGQMSLDPITPLQAAPTPAEPVLGTPEGAAQLGADMSSVAPAQFDQPVTTDPFVPVLPPLPPLPPLDDSLPPLPPPPALPDFSQPPAPLSGAVTGDVFGDTAPAQQAPAAPAPAPEPGQYRIPGQG